LNNIFDHGVFPRQIRKTSKKRSIEETGLVPSATLARISEFFFNFQNVINERNFKERHNENKY